MCKKSANFTLTLCKQRNQMNFKRRILKDLESWAERPQRKPLILRGARQVGKTTAVRIFSERFKHFIDLNLEKQEDRAYFTRFERIPDLVQALFFRYNIPGDETNVLLFIDEIQAEPAAVSKLRYFYEYYPNLCVIAAGSLLESLLESQTSFPVGRVEYLVLRPVSFEEFLTAIGEEEAAKMLSHIPLPDYAYPKLLDLFHQYALIGGMPEIVQIYAMFRDLTKLKPVYNTLLTSYQDDVQKYASAGARAEVLLHCIRNIFFEAGGRIKFQGFGHSNYGSREIGEALRLLEQTMLLHLVYPTVETQLPGKPDLRKQPYLQAIDTGLVNYFSGLQESIIGTKNLHESYRGKIIQHLTGQQILSTLPYPTDNLRFWVREKKQSSAEVDFILPFGNWLIPVEVKSGHVGKLRSLNQFIEQCDHHYAIRLYAGDLQLQETSTPNGKPFSLLNLPYFLGERLIEYVKWMVDKKSY